MRMYRISIMGDKFPTDFNVEATNWATAVSRAIKQWQKRFKGSRATMLKIKAIKSGVLLQANEEEK